MRGRDRRLAIRVWQDSDHTVPAGARPGTCSNFEPRGSVSDPLRFENLRHGWFGRRDARRDPQGDAPGEGARRVRRGAQRRVLFSYDTPFSPAGCACRRRAGPARRGVRRAAAQPRRRRRRPPVRAAAPPCSSPSRARAAGAADAPAKLAIGVSGASCSTSRSTTSSRRRASCSSPTPPAGGAARRARGRARRAAACAAVPEFGPAGGRRGRRAPGRGRARGHVELGGRPGAARLQVRGGAAARQQRASRPREHVALRGRDGREPVLNLSTGHIGSGRRPGRSAGTTGALTHYSERAGSTARREARHHHRAHGRRVQLRGRRRRPVRDPQLAGTSRLGHRDHGSRRRVDGRARGRAREPRVRPHHRGGHRRSRRRGARARRAAQPRQQLLHQLGRAAALLAARAPRGCGVGARGAPPGDAGPSLLASAPAATSADFAAQFAKLGAALAADRRGAARRARRRGRGGAAASRDRERARGAVPRAQGGRRQGPRHSRRGGGGTRPSSSSTRRVASRAEHGGAARFDAAGMPTGALLAAKFERLEASSRAACGTRRASSGGNVQTLAIPLGRRDEPRGGRRVQSASRSARRRRPTRRRRATTPTRAEVLPIVPFEACLERWAAPGAVDDCTDRARPRARPRRRAATFPRYARASTARVANGDVKPPPPPPPLSGTRASRSRATTSTRRRGRRKLGCACRCPAAGLSALARPAASAGREALAGGESRPRPPRRPRPRRPRRPPTRRSSRSSSWALATTRAGARLATNNNPRPRAIG